MFREMRRTKQELSKEDTTAILEKGTSGVLAVSGDSNYPYTVPLSYVYTDGKIFFHCAKQGHKLDGIAKNDKVSFCVIAQDKIVPEEFTTYFKSVVVFGRASIVTDDANKLKALECLSKKYSPVGDERIKKEIEKSWNTVCLVEIAIEHITGKAAIEII